MSRPIDLWPLQRHRGRAGYSGRGLDAVSPPADTPLSVAATIAYNAIQEAIRLEAAARRAAGEDWSANGDWISAQLNQRKADAWHALCGSLGLVLERLQSVPQTPAIKSLVRQVGRAHRASARVSS